MAAPTNMGVFLDRRDMSYVSSMGKSNNPADTYRAGLKRPDKPGQYARARISRLNSAHAAVATGSAAVFNPSVPMQPNNQFAPVPSVVNEHVQRSQIMHAGTQTVLPGRRGFIRRR